jgi:hypothetical protein
LGGGGGREEGKGEREEEEGRWTRVTRSTMNEGSLFVIGSRKLKLDRMANPDVPKLGRQEALLFLFIQFQQLLDIDPHAEREREGPWSERRSSRARFRGCFVIVEEKRLACSFCQSQTSNPSLSSRRALAFALQRPRLRLTSAREESSAAAKGCAAARGSSVAAISDNEWGRKLSFFFF